MEVLLKGNVSTGSLKYFGDQTMELYEQIFPRVARFVQSHGGTLEEAMDVFHDAMVIYLEVASKNKHKIHTSEHLSSNPA